MDSTKTKPVDRISISLPEDLHAELDLMVAERGFESRSQAIKDMLRQHLVEHKVQTGKQVMVGTITLLYNNASSGLQKTLADLQYQYVNEVISSLQNIGEAVSFENTERRIGDPSFLVADISKAFRLLKWKPKFPDIEETLVNAVNWHKKNGF